MVDCFPPFPLYYPTYLPRLNTFLAAEQQQVLTFPASSSYLAPFVGW